MKNKSFITKKEYDRQYYIKNKKKIYLRNRKYSLSHPEVQRIANSKYYEKNKENELLRLKRYCEENPEKRKNTYKEYNKSTKGKLNTRRYLTSPRGIIVNRLKVLRRNERKRKLDVKIRIDDINKALELYKNKCFNCNTKTGLEIDHYYPISKGYGIMHNGFNISFLCRKCNVEKRDKLPEEFFSKDKIEEFKRIKERFILWKKYK